MDHDWIIAIAVAGFLGLFAVALAMIAARVGPPRAARREPANADQLRQHLDKSARRLIEEVEPRVAQLERLIKIADEKLIALDEQNTLAEENLHKLALLKSAPAASRRAEPEAPRINHELRSLNDHIRRTLEEYRRDLAKHKQDIAELVAPIAILSEPLPHAVHDPFGVALGATAAEAGDRYEDDAAVDPADAVHEADDAPAGFTPYAGGFFPADDDDGSFMNKRMSDVVRLAESGLPVEDICHAVRMERKAVEMINGLSGSAQGVRARSRVA